LAAARHITVKALWSAFNRFGLVISRRASRR
jgi:hypothetical protein